MVNKVNSLLIALVFIIISGCATVQLESNGVPIPNHIMRANLPSSGIVLDTKAILYYNEEEGGELLDKYVYLDQRAQESVVKGKYLKNIILTINVHNPNKREYQLWVKRELYSSDKTYAESKEEMLYRGTLSRKEFFIELPTQEGTIGRASYELRDAEGSIIFQGSTFRYRVPVVSG